MQTNTACIKPLQVTTLVLEATLPTRNLALLKLVNLTNNDLGVAGKRIPPALSYTSQQKTLQSYQAFYSVTSNHLSPRS